MLITLVLLLVAADRIGVAVAESKVASKVQSSQQLTNRPSVTIEGFPFLTQVISNRYQAVQLSAGGVTLGSGQDRLQVKTLTARLTGVRATGNYSGVTARTVAGTATVGYPELSRVLGFPLGYGGPAANGSGRVRASRSVSVLGKSIAATVTATVSITGAEMLSFSAVKVSVADAGVSLPQVLTDQLASIFAKQLSLNGLPFKLRVRSLAATAAGVSVSADAQNVNLG